MISSLQSRCGRHSSAKFRVSCAMQQRVVPSGLIRGSLGLNSPPAHPIILTGAQQAAETSPRKWRRRQSNLYRLAGIADNAACNVVDRLGSQTPRSVHQATLFIYSSPT